MQNNNQRLNHHPNSAGLVVTSSSSSSSLSSHNSSNNNQAKLHHQKVAPLTSSLSTTTTTSASAITNTNTNITINTNNTNNINNINKSIGKMFIPTQQKSNPHRIMKIVVPQSKITTSTTERPPSPTAFNTNTTGTIKDFRHTVSSSFDPKLLRSPQPPPPPPPPTNLPTSSSPATLTTIHQTTQNLYGNKKALSSPVLRHLQPPPPPPPIHTHSSSAVNKPLSLPPQVVLKLQPLTASSSTSSMKNNANQNIITSQNIVQPNQNTSSSQNIGPSTHPLSAISAQNLVNKPVTAPHCKPTIANQNNNINNIFSTTVLRSTKTPQSMQTNVLPSPGSLVKPKTPQSNNHIMLRIDSNSNPPPLSLPPSKMATTENFLTSNSANGNTTCDSKNILPNNAFYNKNNKGPPKKQPQQHQQQFQPSSPVLSRPRSNSVPNHTGSAYQPLLSSSPSTTTNISSLPHTKAGITSNQLRRGKWTVEEEAYVARVIQDFNSGYLNAPAGTTLRTYLSDKLNCDPMRITKKFTGDSCIGKRVFHPAVRCSNNAPLIDKAQAELEALESRWKRRLEMQQRESAKKAAATAAVAVVAGANGRHCSNPLLLQLQDRHSNKTGNKNDTFASTNTNSMGSFPNMKLSNHQLQQTVITSTATWLDRANAILSGAASNTLAQTINYPVPNKKNNNHSLNIPQKSGGQHIEVENQMKEVQQLIHEGPLIKQNSEGLPRLLEGTASPAVNHNVNDNSKISSTAATLVKRTLQPSSATYSGQMNVSSSSSSQLVPVTSKRKVSDDQSKVLTSHRQHHLTTLISSSQTSQTGSSYPPQIPVQSSSFQRNPTQALSSPPNLSSGMNNAVAKNIGVITHGKYAPNVTNTLANGNTQYYNANSNPDNSPTSKIEVKRARKATSTPSVVLLSSQNSSFISKPPTNFNNHGFNTHTNQQDPSVSSKEAEDAATLMGFLTSVRAAAESSAATSTNTSN